jgi:dTDP-4-dehydrorhamnose reductase
MQVDRRPIAVTGSSGQLGGELCRRLGDAAAPLSRRDLDLSRPDGLRAVIERLRPRAVINCAAWTAVDLAETRQEECLAVNATAVEALAAACEAVDCPLVQVSTDYVFGADRGRRQPYREDDEPGPLGFYGTSKLAGEAAAKRWKNHLVVRTCGLYSVGEQGPVRGRNFADTMLVLARERPEVTVVDDQFCAPSYVPHMAAAILSLLDTSLSRGVTGTFHAVNRGVTTWHAFASELFRLMELPVTVRPIASRDRPSPVERPTFSVLDADKLEGVIGSRLPSWQEGLAAYVTAVGARTAG